MSRFGDYITQGVSTVAGPLQSSGGAVDIIVVEQEDGTFRSTPWYVKFGKVFGVISRTEKTVAVAVNGEDANFHMYLDRSGHSYFLNEGETLENELSMEITHVTKSILPIDDGFPKNDRAYKVEGCSSDTCSKVSPLNDDFAISRERKPGKKRLRQLKSMFGLVFRFTIQRFSDPHKNRKKASDRVALLEMAEIAADLLERKWCTGYPKQKTPHDSNHGDDNDDAKFQNIETEKDNSEVVLVSVDGHVIKAPVSLLDKHLGEGPTVLSSFHDQVVFTECGPISSAQHLTSCDYDNVRVDNVVNNTLRENLDHQVTLRMCDSVCDVNGNHKEQNEDPGDLNQQNGCERSCLYDTVSSLQEGGMDQSHKSRTTTSENAQLTDIADGSNLDYLSGIRSELSEVQIPSKCLLGTQEKYATRHISVPMSETRHDSFNAEITGGSVASLKSWYGRQNSNECVQTANATGMGSAAAGQAFDCENVSKRELNSSGLAESVGAIVADHFQATESKRQPRRQKVRTNTPTSEQLSSLNLKGGQNIVTFTFLSNVFGKQQVDARIYMWKWNTRIVVSDVDGTITKSDVLGHVMPMVGKDWSQVGVARLFSAIKDNGYQLLFLSARAISQAHVTRQFLLNLKQEGETLPDGPIVISPDGLFPSLYREVIRRAPHEFKIACLKDIKGLFPCDGNPFYAGFGNRDTDEISYLKVGIPKGKIFTINSKGEVIINCHVDAKSYTSLHKFADDMFPSMLSSEHEDFNSWNYWKVPLPRIED